MEKQILISNLLPKDGEVFYFGAIFTQKESESLFYALLTRVNWQNDVVKIFGKTHITARKVAFYANRPITYKYSGQVKTAEIFNPTLVQILSQIENLTGKKYNACLLNLYHTGTEGMGWHSDNEKEIVQNSSIASLSFGAERKFQFKHKRTSEKVEILLENGSLLLMGADTQANWLHRLPPTKQVNSPRINLIFRLME